MTRATDADEQRAVETLGAAVRDVRKRLGRSVQALSEKAGVSFGLVSQLERGLGNPSLQSLQRLAGALGIPVAQLLDEPAAPLDPREAPHHAGRRRRSRVAARSARTADAPRRVLIRSTLPAGFSNEARPFRHIGTETVTVESGVLVVCQADRRVELRAGDTVTYGCSEPHWWANGHDAEAVVLGAVTPFER